MNKRVILTIGIIVLIALVFLFFKLFHKECVQPEISMDPEKPVQGQAITFKCSNASEGESFTWEFGDSSGTFKGIEQTHKFKTAGTYTIKAIRDENCITEKEVTVLAKKKFIFIAPTINYPSEIHVNEPVTFSDATNDVNTWTWKIMETEEIGYDKSFNTTFKKAGRYTISLIINGNTIKGDTMFSFDVIEGVSSETPKKVISPTVVTNVPKPKAETPKIVAEKPKTEPKSLPEPKPKTEPKPKPEPKPLPETKAKAEPAAPTFLSDAEFTSNFISIANALANEDEDASNLWRDKIVPQTGTKGTMKVIVKDGAQLIEKTLESFKKNQLISSEPYKILNVTEIKRADKKGPIIQITVLVSKN